MSHRCLPRPETEARHSQSNLATPDRCRPPQDRSTTQPVQPGYARPLPPTPKQQHDTASPTWLRQTAASHPKTEARHSQSNLATPDRCLPPQNSSTTQPVQPGYARPLPPTPKQQHDTAGRRNLESFRDRGLRRGRELWPSHLIGSRLACLGSEERGLIRHPGERIRGAGAAAVGSHLAAARDPAVVMATVGVHGPAVWDLTVVACDVGSTREARRVPHGLRAAAAAHRTARRDRSVAQGCAGRGRRGPTGSGDPRVVQRVVKRRGLGRRRQTQRDEPMAGDEPATR
ncbi:hypothetical protein CLV67_11816 [Actinoplanes italicus]|uniref:Uncharacterized protein n=1 Tax=Actinoplanes italicus TaxID=113567 RepID=A0A2T0K1J9_9ACTN|nr:hypothetical protein CLV67_11816 [Actinoplanes italicus]